MKLILILFILAVILVGVAEAQQPGQVPWWTSDSGSAESNSVNYRMEGTVGQPDAARSAGATYQASWGYWKPTPLQVVDSLESGALQLEHSATFGDLFEGSAWLIVTAASLARWAVGQWSL